MKLRESWGRKFASYGLVANTDIGERQRSSLLSLSIHLGLSVP